MPKTDGRRPISTYQEGNIQLLHTADLPEDQGEVVPLHVCLQLYDSFPTLVLSMERSWKTSQLSSQKPWPHFFTPQKPWPHFSIPHSVGGDKKYLPRDSNQTPPSEAPKAMVNPTTKVRSKTEQPHLTHWEHATHQQTVARDDVASDRRQDERERNLKGRGHGE